MKDKNDLCIAVTTNKPHELLSHVHTILNSLGARFASPSENAYLINGEVYQNTWKAKLEEEKLQKEIEWERERERQRKERERQERIDEERKQLQVMQQYLEQYQQVVSALEADPSNQDLLQAKSDLEEVIALTDQLHGAQREEKEEDSPSVQLAESSQRKKRRHEEIEEEEGKGKSKEEEEEEEEPGVQESQQGGASSHKLFEFKLQILQSQPQRYMVECGWKEGTDRLGFYQFFEYLKQQILNKFLRT